MNQPIIDEDFDVVEYLYSVAGEIDNIHRSRSDSNENSPKVSMQLEDLQMNVTTVAEKIYILRDKVRVPKVIYDSFFKE